MKRFLIESTWTAWRLCERHLPASLSSRIRATGTRYLSPQAQQALREHFRSEPEYSTFSTPLPDAGDRSNDGMRDYPTTRPHLAFDYIAGLVRWLADSDYKVLSYNDLAGPFVHGDEAVEFQKWISKAKNAGEKGILLQYDVDARPDITHELMKVHIACRVPGNAMVFRQKIFDWKLKRNGVLEVDDDYTLDFALFERFQKAGGVIGYHCNAFDRSGGNIERAIEILHEDVAALRKHVDLKFFSMHGGHVTPDGMCNARLPVGRYLKNLGLTWVHNGHSVYFHTNWADGSASNPRYRSESNDPLDFILSTKAGERSRLLFHPQYYNDLSSTKFDFPILQDQQWIRETRNTVEAGGFDGKAYWRKRHAQAQASMDAFKPLFVAPPGERPVFISGMSRSGTTLLVSMFDAHGKGAMAYESYPRYLNVPADDGVLTPVEYIYVYQTLMNYPDTMAFKLLSRSPLKNLMRFAAVTSWTGMTTRETGELLRTYLVEHHRVADTREALRIVAATARYKVKAEGAEFWGTKCQGNYEDYFALWPQARLIYIMRNGLDILASQKTTGAFRPDPAQLGKNWRTQYERFQSFRKANPAFTTAQVHYEQLVADPEATIRAVCKAIELPYDPQMIRQHEVETTLAKNPRGQLSAERVQQPIDSAAINKWKTILTPEEARTFIDAAGGTELFERHGLEWRF